MLYGEVVLQYSSISWFNSVFGVESKATSDSKIVVLYSDGEIKDIMHSSNTSNTILFGDSDFKVSGGKVFKYVVPVNGSYYHTHIHDLNAFQNVQLEASRFNIIYEHNSKYVFFLMRVKSSDRIPRFIFGFDETCLNKPNVEEIIKKVLM